jgi:hypothetical protein
MPNAFNSANYPTTEPAVLVIGDRWAWKRQDLGADYPPASYTLKYSLRLEGAATEIEITATASGSDYVIEVSKATTLGYTLGRYQWQAYITRNSDSERITIEIGVFDIQPNRDLLAVDPRSHPRKVLAAIEAVIEGRATKDQQSYSIAAGAGSRTLARTPIPELLMLRDRYRAEVNAEDLRDALKKTGINPRHIGVRFVRI